MAGAIQSFSEAISSYRASIASYAIYSILLAIASTMIAFFAIFCLGVVGIFSAGSIVSFFASTPQSSVEMVGVAASLFMIFLGLFALLWASSGLHGAYLSTLNLFISKRAQSPAGFFLSVPKYATNVMLLSIICGVLVGAPFVLAFALSPAMGPLLLVIVLLLLALYAIVLGLFLVFSLPCVVVDNKGPLSAMKTSAALSMRNMPEVIIFVIGASALALPTLIPFLGALYMWLFYLPIATSALLRLYRTAK